MHGGQERLGREILGQAGVAAAGQQVAIDVRQRIVIQRQQPERRVGPHLRVRHTFIVVRAAGTPTARAGLFPADGGVHLLEDRQRRIIAWHPLRALNAITVRVFGADLLTVALPA